VKKTFLILVLGFLLGLLPLQIHAGQFGEDLGLLGVGNVINTAPEYWDNITNKTPSANALYDYFIIFDPDLDGTIEGGEVKLNTVGSPAYDDVQDWLNTTQSAGILSGGELTDAGASGVTVSAGQGFIKLTDSEIGEVAFFSWAETLVPLTDAVLNYIYVTTSGVTSTTTDSDINHTTELRLGKVYKDGSELHMLTGGTDAYNLARKVHRRLGKVDGFARGAGLVLGDGGNQTITITAGTFFKGLNEFNVDSFDSAMSPFSTWYYDGSAWVETTGVTEVSITQYNNTASGLANLTSSDKYGVHFVYIHEDEDVHVVYGQDKYKLAEAQVTTLPSSLPAKVSLMGAAVGRIIVEKDVVTFKEVSDYWKEGFEASGVVDHNGLANLQGGEVDQYYHLTNAQHGDLTTGYRTIYVPANVMTPTATDFATAGTHEYATNDVNLDYYSFDGATRQYIEYSRVLDAQWDLSTIKFKFYWTPGASSCTAGDTVEWAVTAEAVSDDDPIDVASGVSQVVSDTVTAGKNGDMHITAATPALTVAGTPASGDLIHFKFSRNVNGIDDMEEKGWLVGVFFQYRIGTIPAAW